MESLLNLSWVLLSLVVLCLWLRFGARDSNRNTPSFVALVMLVVILFPVISVSDDLWSLQNPAETDTCQRRDHIASCTHAIFPASPALPAPFMALPALPSERCTMIPQSSCPAFKHPSLDGVQNRPPPIA